MKVQQLIEKLQTLPKNATVLLDNGRGGGCTELGDDHILFKSNVEVYTDYEREPLTGDFVFLTTWA